MIQQPICTDDYGTSVYACRYSKLATWADEAVKIGALIPGVKAAFYMHPESRNLHKKSVAAFHESEANCNTCRDLRRIPHAKSPHGFLQGVCARGKLPGVYSFNPDDPMHMDCWRAR